MFSPKRILITALDWGLGHATRSMPIIDHLIRQGHQVLLASSGLSRELYLRHYPNLIVRDLPAYRVKYNRRRSQLFTLAKQIPRLKRVIQEEHDWTIHWAEKLEIDAIISDNRYGCWHPSIPSAIICHQIAPMLPFAVQPFRPLLYKTHRRYLENFDKIWIPDFEGEVNMSGMLSHQYELPKSSEFIGPLSRFSPMTQDSWLHVPREIMYMEPEIFIILSGPEPQRSILEQIVWEQVQKQDRPTLMVQGKPGPIHIRNQGKHVYMSFLPAEGINHFLRRSKFIISRSGYTSIMEYASLGLRNIILIPTPGQSEQLYLARLAKKTGWAFSVAQHKFKLDQALEEAKTSPGFPPTQGFLGFREKVDIWIAEGKGWKQKYVEEPKKEEIKEKVKEESEAAENN